MWLSNDPLSTWLRITLAYRILKVTFDVTSHFLDKVTLLTKILTGQLSVMPVSFITPNILIVPNEMPLV